MNTNVEHINTDAEWCLKKLRDLFYDCNLQKVFGCPTITTVLDKYQNDFHELVLILNEIE